MERLEEVGDLARLKFPTLYLPAAFPEREMWIRGKRQKARIEIRSSKRLPIDPALARRVTRTDQS